MSSSVHNVPEHTPQDPPDHAAERALTGATPLVTVAIITYNQEQFIEQTVRSVLMQVVDFEYEILIGEDCSTDRTRDIVLALQQQYPLVIKPILHAHNVGMLENFVGGIRRAKGKYVALLDGDDYWLDPYKLAKQVRFLEANPAYALVCSNAIKLRHEKNEATGLLFKAIDAFDFDTRTLMLRNPGLTSTVLFRNGLIQEFPAIYFTGLEGDRRLYMLLSRHGKCRYLPEVTAVYRLHTRSVSHQWYATYPGRKERLLYTMAAAEEWNRYFGGEFDREVAEVHHQAARSLVLHALVNFDLATALRFAPRIDRDKAGWWESTFIYAGLQLLARIRSRQGDGLP